MVCQIIGTCRFSFLGKGDWIGMRGNVVVDAEKLNQQLAVIYAPGRLARRFEAFEKMLLPSIRAQTDPDFQLWILTSPELPDYAMQRLQMVCADIPQIHIIVSKERMTKKAFVGPLRQAEEEAGGTVVQFRIDDDDALSKNFIARLKENVQRFDDLPSYAISLARGLVIRSYKGEPLSYWRVLQRFGSAGAAIKAREPGRSIYATNHFDIPVSFPSFTDLRELNYIQLRWDEGDSAVPAHENWNARHAEIGQAEFEDVIAGEFPFLTDADLDFITQSS